MQNYDGQFKLNGQEYFYRAKDDSGSSKITRVNNEEHHYRMAKFCPCEENGTVSYDEIKVWVDKLIRILDSNHQKEMFGYVLGRLFVYAPKAADGPMMQLASLRRAVTSV